MFFCFFYPAQANSKSKANNKKAPKKWAQGKTVTRVGL